MFNAVAAPNATNRTGPDGYGLVGHSYFEPIPSATSSVQAMSSAMKMRWRRPAYTARSLRETDEPLEPRRGARSDARSVAPTDPAGASCGGTPARGGGTAAVSAAAGEGSNAVGATLGDTPACASLAAAPNATNCAAMAAAAVSASAIAHTPRPLVSRSPRSTSDSRTAPITPAT